MIYICCNRKIGDMKMFGLSSEVYSKVMNVVKNIIMISIYLAQEPQEDIRNTQI